jgi:UDPglucose 6-dehydrogenase
MVRKIEQTLGNLRNKRIGILGLSFKPNTSDVRESPAVDIAKALIDKGARLAAYDPEGIEEFKLVVQSEKLSYAKDAYAAAEDADAVVLLTEWNEFRNLDLAKIKSLMSNPTLFDLRNIYEPVLAQELGFTYVGVGRGVLFEQ